MPGSNKAKKLKCQTNERYFSLTSQEAVKKKYHFPQRAAITLMNAQHVNLLAEKKSIILFDEMFRTKSRRW